MPPIPIGRDDTALVNLEPRHGNRDGMVAGATCTGKPVSPVVLAEGFSRLGLPCTGMIEATGEQVVRTTGSRPGPWILRNGPGGVSGGRR